MEQTSINFGSGSDTPKSISYQVTEKGFYCVGVVSYAIDNDVEPGFTGYAKFHNVFPGNLPATTYPLKSLYGCLASLYTGLFFLWRYLCHVSQTGNRSNFVQLFGSRLGSLVLVLVSDVLIQWVYMSLINHQDVDVAHWRNVHGYWPGTLLARVSLLASVLSSTVRDGLVYAIMQSFAFNPAVVQSMAFGPAVSRKVSRSMTISNVLYWTCICFNPLFYYCNAWSLFGIKGIWHLSPMFFFFFLNFLFVFAVANSLSHHVRQMTRQHQKHLKRLFGHLYLVFALIAYMKLYLCKLLFESEERGDISEHMHLVVSHWPYLWRENDGFLHAHFVLCESCVCSCPALVLLMIILRPTAHNTSGILSNELVMNARAQDGHFKSTLNGDRHEPDDTTNQPLPNPTKDTYKDEAPPPDSCRSFDTHPDQYKQSFDLDTKTSESR